MLDPACGSGNFLYICLQALKDLEREALLWGSLTMRLPMQLPRVGPHQLRGIEINPYAAELTRVTIWIGEFQWMLRNGFGYARDPILKPLTNIETRDALIDWSDAEHPKEADWPDADVIIGNPPFLGRGLLRSGLGDDYVDGMFKVFEDRVPHAADFVTYWHEKARAMVEDGHTKRVGLLANQSIRSGASRKVVERIKETGDLFFALADEPWVLAGAVVHVSFLGFDDGSESERALNGNSVPSINANLTAGIDLTQAKRLSENAGIAFQGPVKVGPFEVRAEMARQMLEAHNPHGRPNSDVLRPWVNGLDLMRRPRGMWIIDFGTDMTREKAALYQAPFEYIDQYVRVRRASNRDRQRRENWWRLGRSGGELRAAVSALHRYIATTRLSPHRLFVWILPTF